ncbi:HAD-superfamily subfamily IIA hydrolase [Cystobasidium minutum MCA 4210]|uniref:HAD-superfamily subfamily IIA hydrolase n=1 Tax=Cystobasidium minutum MCA 4210 TaxID=1397322 RepID=UPI0034D017EE|eukprot:jgi/Rhomi1/76897/CE76896_910
MHQRSVQTILRNRLRRLQSRQNASVEDFPRSSLVIRRLKSTSSPADAPVAPGFIFDIDGVLKIGEKVLPQGHKALQILSGDNKLSRRFPFILVTNGGGISEEERCYKLSRELGIELSVDQLIQSHTVFREQAKNFGDKPILIVGGTGHSCREVARSYGFKKVYTPHDLLAWRQELWPFKSLTENDEKSVQRVDFSQVPFSAIFVFHDSRDWGFDTQIMLDVLMSPDGTVTTWRDPEAEWTQQVPVFFSNPDLLWGNDWPEPRLGQGAFQEAFRAVWRRTSGRELEATTGGKPTKLTYQHAERLLLAQANHPDILPPGGRQVQKLGPTFMIGDNPFSDIAGANAYGLSSILVRTGVFRGKDNHAEHPATTVQPDVLAAVRWALKKELGEDIV